jgi:microcystin-dependent protein
MFKKLLIGFFMFLSADAFATGTTKISQFPIGTASACNANDAFAYFSYGNSTDQTIIESDLPNLPSLQATFLTKSSAASTYLTQSSASSTYLTQSSAASTYETQTAASALAPKASPTFTGTVTAPALTLSTTPLAVGSGGVGAATLPSANLLLGNGTSAVTGLPPGGSGNIPTSNGSTWTSAAPAQQVPSGTVIMFAGTSCPTAYLATDGTLYSTTTYATLYAAIGTTYGSGSGTFGVPNTKGVFIRGAGSQTIGGISYSGTQGTTQGDQMQGHLHQQTTGGTGGSLTQTSNFTTGNSGQTATSSNTTGPVSDGTNGTPRTGTQTYPANITLLYCIKT